MNLPMKPFTARNASKFVAKSIVTLGVAKQTAEIVDDYTQLDEDDNIVTIGSTLVGWYVSDKLKPVTDKIVDTTFDFVIAQRVKHQVKKVATQ
jgi:hypothetical protein